MLNKLTYKQRNLLLVALSLVFGFIVYSKALSNTFALMDDCELLESQLATANNSPQNVAQLRAELKALDAFANSENSTRESHQKVLEQMSFYCGEHDLHVTDFPEPSTFETEKFTIVTGSAEAEGSFHNLVQLVHELEQHPQGFKVASVRLYTQTNVQSKKTKLYARIYFQNIQQS
jgi:hypothetical protein